ncbi:MAG: restriction endonuclease subunit S [Clostridia bacterium]|nr:restriction endonuclease subunit S [Clostridia bacterium]
MERGKRLKKADQIQGKTPYISSTADNNGVDGFIEVNKGSRVFCNCISLANSGSVGSAFFEPFLFVASDHVTHLKNEDFNKAQYLFISCVLRLQKSNYGFNREINDERLKNMRIMLPVQENGTPDYGFMDNVGRLIMCEKYLKYLLHTEKNKY